jgi:hypothetical protein
MVKSHHEEPWCSVSALPSGNYKCSGVLGSSTLIRDLAMICMNFPGRHVSVDARTTFEISSQLGQRTIQYSLLVQHEFQYPGGAAPTRRSMLSQSFISGLELTSPPTQCCHKLNNREKHSVVRNPSQDSTPHVIEICCGPRLFRGRDVT